jgi:alpha-L-rhamnosidase
LDYHLYTGDDEFIVQIYNEAKTLMKFCLDRVDDRGFMNARSEDWVFVDWAPIDNKGDVSFIQILFARSLESMATIAKICGYMDEYEKYTLLFKKTLKNCFAFFWSKEKQCFTHGPALADHVMVTKYANIIALLFGYLDSEKREMVVQNVMMSDNVFKITTPYMKFFEMAALCEVNRFDQVKNYIEEYWGGMCSLGATSFWEQYDQNQSGVDHYAMYGRPYGKSLCHAWGAGPIYLLGRYFLGVRPTKAGYTEFEVSPILVGLHDMRGKVPTPMGSIEVHYHKDKLEVKNNTEGIGKIIIGDVTVAIGAFESKTVNITK